MSVDVKVTLALTSVVVVKESGSLVVQVTGLLISYGCILATSRYYCWVLEQDPAQLCPVFSVISHFG